MTDRDDNQRTAPFPSNRFPACVYTPAMPQDPLGFTEKSTVYTQTSAIEDAMYYFLSDNAKKQPSISGSPYDIHRIRKDFPILREKVNGYPLIWLDNAATTQKPEAVIQAVNTYYREYNSNIHRGAHTLAQKATRAYEAAREKVQRFIGAMRPEELVFVRGATEAINLVAESYGGRYLHEGDEILISEMEHHSNIVPWQKLQKEKNVILQIIPVNDRGEMMLDEYERKLSPRTRIVAVTHVSNVLGTINPVKTMIDMAHRHGAVVLVDGAQGVPHVAVNVQQLDADFYVFSGHKVYGPTGIGVLYGKEALLNTMPPWQRGGGMIQNVSFDNTSYKAAPEKFEAGTGNIAGAVGLGEAVNYIEKIGMPYIERYEKDVTVYAMKRLSEIKKLCILGTSSDKTSVLSFVVDGMDPDKVALELNKKGIAVRSGHHCAQPILKKYGYTSTVRASIGLYNTQDEIDYFVETLKKIVAL